MTRRMYDAVTVPDIPAGATLVAGYADGSYANVPQLRSRFPHAEVATIAVAHTTRAMVADIERGDMTPATAVLWARDTMGDVPNGELTLYANTSTWPSVVAEFKAAGESLPQWFAAQYDGVAVLGPGQIAKQYVDTGGYDESVVADYWPGVDPAPTPPSPPTPSEDDMPLTLADAQLVVSTLLAHQFTDAGEKNPDGSQAVRTLSDLFSFLDLHHTVDLQEDAALAAQVKSLSAQVTALSAALAAVAKGEAATVEAAVAAALKAAGHAAA